MPSVNKNDYDTINEALLSRIDPSFVEVITHYFTEKDRDWKTLFEIIRSDIRFWVLDYFILTYYIYKLEGGKIESGNDMDYLKKIMTQKQALKLMNKIRNSFNDYNIHVNVKEKLGGIMNTVVQLINQDKTFTKTPKILKPRKRDSLYYTLPSVNDKYIDMYDKSGGKQQIMAYTAWRRYMIKTHNTDCISDAESLFTVYDKVYKKENQIEDNLKSMIELKTIDCKHGMIMGQVSFKLKYNGKHLGHANVILFDHNNNVYLFDPMGQNKKYNGLKLKLRNYLKAEGVDTTDFFYFEKFGSGPQHIESRYSRVKNKRGYCFIWALMFMDYITRYYPRESLEFLYLRIMRRGDLKSLVHKYLTLVMDLTESYFKI